MNRDSEEAKPETAARFVPARPTLTRLRAAASGCTACPLYRDATQTVFGEGPAHAPLMLVGEVPGDREDLLGHPFVGPSGRLLDRCLAEAGIDRRRAYLTNVVKHFKYLLRGKKRLHGKLSRAEIRACTPWLLAEIALVRPKLLVCLGATAARTVIAPDFLVSKRRGEFVTSSLGPEIMATVHPAALLRGDPAARDAEIARFVADLKKAAARLS